MKKKLIKLSKYYTRKRTLKSFKRNKVKPYYKNNLDKNKNIISITGNLDTENNKHLLIKIINKIDSIKDTKNITLDHKKLDQISIEALVILTANISIFSKKNNIKLTRRKHLTPKNKKVKHLLNLIGYWEYFDNKSSTNKNNNEIYFKVIKGKSTLANNEEIGLLILKFCDKIKLSNLIIKKMFIAFTEAVANIYEHAYFGDDVKYFWLAISYNNKTKEINMVIYDTGMGIISSVNDSKLKLKIVLKKMNIISKENKESLFIKYMLEDKLSKHKQKKRGKGLSTFKKLADSINGEVIIHSENTYYSSKEPYKSSKDYLKGTLISWRVKD